MKCPKCGYLGFETIDRCRNCGYDFSLSVHVESPPELALYDNGPGEALADFDLSSLETSRDSEGTAGLDLDRLIGGRNTPVDIAAVAPRRHLSLADVAPPPPAVAVVPSAVAASAAALPLFSREADDADEEPFMTPPRPVRPPLSVRRATPDLTRGRRTPRTAPYDPGLALQLEPENNGVAGASATAVNAGGVAGYAAASRSARMLAMLIDLALMLSIDASIVYLTLAITGLTLNDAGVLPPIPLAAFLVLLNGGYLVTFIAASGQTIGKMLTGIRVMADDGQRVDIPAAVLRAGGCALSLLTAGIGYLPAFLTPDGRALQDRVAGTRVVRNK